MRQLLALGSATLIAVLASDSALAQGPSRYSADVNAAVWVLRTNGVYDDDGGGGVAGELSIARSFHSVASAGLVAGANAGYYQQIGSGDTCLLVPGGGCAPQSPSVRLFGTLVGWETRTGWLRAMGGIAYAGPTLGGSALALQGRLDAAVEVVRHVALMASVRPVVIPNYRGDWFRLLGVSLGLRLR